LQGLRWEEKKPEVKKTLGRPRRRWIYFKMDFQEVGWIMDWIYLSYDKKRWRALVSALMNLRVTQNGGGGIS